MAMLRCTFFFTQGRYGWSEHYHNLASTHAAVAALAVELRNNRLAMIPPTAQLTYQRISDDDPPRDSSVIGGAPWLGQSGTIEASDAAFTANLIRFSSGVLKRRNIYLRPAPFGEGKDSDQIINGPGFFNAYNFWKATLIEEANGWAIKNIVSPGQGSFVSAVGQNTDFLQVSVPGLALIVGARVRLSGFKSPVPINGYYKYAGSGGGDVKNLIPPVPGFVGGVTKFGILKEVTYALSQITDVQAIRTVSRKTGRPFDSPRGRSPTVR